MRCFCLNDEGYITAWLLLGPFINKPLDSNAPRHTENSCPAFYTDFLKKVRGEAGVQPRLGDSVKTPEGNNLKWIFHFSPGFSVNLRNIFTPYEQVLAYAYCEIELKRAKNLLFKAGSDDGIKVFIDGKAAWENHVARGVNKDEDLFTCRLKAGRHRILVKVCQDSAGWGFCLGLTQKEDVSAGKGVCIPPADTTICIPGNIDRKQILEKSLASISPKHAYLEKPVAFSLYCPCSLPVLNENCTVALSIRDRFNRKVFSKKEKCRGEQINAVWKDIWKPDSHEDGRYACRFEFISSGLHVKNEFAFQVLWSFSSSLEERIRNLRKRLQQLLSDSKPRTVLDQNRLLTLGHWLEQFEGLSKGGGRTRNFGEMDLRMRQMEVMTKYLEERKIPEKGDIVSLMRVVSDPEVESAWEVGTETEIGDPEAIVTAININYAGLPLCWAAVADTKKIDKILERKRIAGQILKNKGVHVILKKIAGQKFDIAMEKDKFRFILGFQRHGDTMRIFEVMGITQKAGELLLERIIQQQPFTEKDVETARKSIRCKKDAANPPANHEVLIGDMHVHSNCSDGTLPPFGVVKTCIRDFMDFIALSDHDTTRGSILANEEAKKYNLSFPVIPAQEASAVYSHILIYGTEKIIKASEDPDKLLNDAKKAGGSVFIAHPGNPFEVRCLGQRGLRTFWSEAQLKNKTRYDGFEAVFETDYYQPWVKNPSRMPRLICGADSHAPYHFLWPLRTIVFTKDSSWRGILEAINQGLCLAYTGADIWGRENLVNAFKRMLAESQTLQEKHIGRLKNRIKPLMQVLNPPMAD